MTARHILFEELRDAVLVPGRSEQPHTWELSSREEMGVVISACFSLPAGGAVPSSRFVVLADPQGGWRAWYAMEGVEGKIKPSRHSTAEDAVARLHLSPCDVDSEQSIRDELDAALAAATQFDAPYNWTIPAIRRPGEARAYRVLSTGPKGMRTVTVAAVPGVKWHAWEKWTSLGGATQQVKTRLCGVYDSAAQAVAQIDA